MFRYFLNLFSRNQNRTPRPERKRPSPRLEELETRTVLSGGLGGLGVASIAALVPGDADSARPAPVVETPAGDVGGPAGHTVEVALDGHTPPGLEIAPGLGRMSERLLSVVESVVNTLR